MRSFQRRPRSTLRVTAPAPLVIETQVLDRERSQHTSWFSWMLFCFRPARVVSVAPTPARPIRPHVSHVSTSPLACIVAFNQSRWMAIVVAATTIPRVPIDPVVRWYSSQITKRVLSSETVLQLLRSPKFDHHFALVQSCFLNAKQVVVDGAHAMSMLGCLPATERQIILCEHLLNDPSSTVAGLLPGATRLLSDPTNLRTWHDALRMMETLHSSTTVWRDPDLALRLMLCLSRSPPAHTSSRVHQNALLESTPQLHAVAVSRQFCRESLWLLALCSCPLNHAVRDELNVRARFEIGDWVGALEAATTSSSSALRSTAIELLIRNEQTVLACVAIRQSDRDSTKLSPASIALLLAQLARRKRTHDESQWYRLVIDDMINILHQREHVGNPAVDVAAAVALGACGSWERVLRLCAGHSGSIPIVMTLLVAAAGGGAPWEVLQRHTVSLMKTSSPTSASTCEMLVRCALEAGAWQEAVQMYVNNHQAYKLPVEVLDHPSLVSHVSVPFSSTTYSFVGQWREALEAERRAGVISTLQTSAGRCLAANEHCWQVALSITQTTEERLRVARNLLETSLWQVGLELLTAALPTETPTVRTLFLHSAARTLSSRNPKASLDLLATHDSECLGSKGRAALLLQTVLKSPSNGAMDALVPWLSWSDAIICLQRHRERPSTAVFLNSVLTYYHHQPARQTKLMVALRLLSSRRGRRLPSERSFTLLFEAQRTRAFASLSATPIPAVETEEHGLPQDLEAGPASGLRAWWAALELLSRPISATTKRPWQHLGDCPDDLLIHAVTTRRPSQDAAGLCVSGLSARGRWELATRMMQSLASQKTFPDMESLVELIESAVRLPSDAPLLHCVDALRQCTPPSVFNNVLRAVAERSANERGATWAGALQVLSTVALAGVPYVPSSVVQRIAELAPSKAARAAMHLLDARSSSQQTSPMAMDAAAICHVVSAAATAQLEPIVEVFEMRRGSFTGAMSTLPFTFDGSSNKVIRRLATLPMPSLWYIALEACMSKATTRSYNRAFLLTAVGCDDGATLTKVALAMGGHVGASQSLLAPKSALPAFQSRGSGYSPMTCCAVSCALAHKFGKWELALQVLPANDELSRTARVAITHCTGHFDDALKETLQLYRQELKKKPRAPRTSQREALRILACSNDLTDRNPLWWIL
ncbi:Hypothetical protein, putative [Bodo saltans]|uniref:Uncharacterized protein n=1 Tax=Bodo saltans TaxID=75058 RepID=A0A0S4JL40_BODSA|nr:Hypothetical protein, putative [Bodo saltans]|eukprot:CUG92244.1 Hypothetical protein, putative [Bodo saltans]